MQLEKLDTVTTRLSWQAAPGAPSYSISRGILALLGPSEFGSCLATGNTSLTFDDDLPLAPGVGLFYMVRGDGCGAGTLGTGFDALERQNANPGACP